MADASMMYDNAFSLVVEIYEGLKYSDTPGDAGGETFAGISRVAWPNLELWIFVDECKRNGIPIVADGKLLEYIKRFYFDNYWKASGAYALPPVAALEQFDSAVNLGSKRAITYLQEIFNVLNNFGKRWEELSADGKWGPACESVAKQFASTRLVGAKGVIDNEVLLANMINHKQAMHYFTRIAAKPDQEKFALSWFART